jgi:hypothetical protein
MNLEKQFRDETGKDSLVPDDYGGYYYSDEYVEWLEQMVVKLFAMPDLSNKPIRGTNQ